ncbi:50S ribosomal protein L11 methyltransferase [Niabella ginsengisoli]|uniref:Ribosomal protein L11 methyltransferase n=1 Tax=Niabella ginsengisoli TaxID=522298 RepID=A0ABS9SGC6_9BACT|nr:50S ribosomal protein L11 methyltransferase [Niabella ginsengisoli]MCH5597417.1 50S ribosomal protein L11 methyltransferase [Niabella ginsengisoli]
MYTQIIFSNIAEEIKDIVIASLQDKAEGFEETDHELKAIFLTEQFDEASINEIASAHHILYQKEKIETQNWNALWESNFSPVVVDGFVGIRASFHEPMKGVEHEIVITPKMSFGTGHHATTHLMMQQMQKIDFTNKAVFDFGTGTGVLAILAHKLGASSVVANDIDDWSIANAKENFEKNDTAGISLIQSDSGLLDQKFDIILANINRNVLINNIPVLSNQLKEKGVIILSGILEEDEEIITNTAQSSQLDLVEKISRNKWICLIFSYES